MMNVEFSLSDELPGGYRTLLWHTFFEDRQRGFSLEDHFPPDSLDRQRVKFAWLRAGVEVVAGLMVRVLTPAVGSAASAEAAAIGLVCVAQAHRGLGLSRRLLQECLTALASEGITAFTLWTGKPAVYQSLGFVTADDSLLAWVSGPTCESQAVSKPIFVQRWPDDQERATLNRGLPPFALGAQRLACPEQDASAIVLADPLGLAVAEWSGSETRIVDMLAQVMPPRWRLHARGGDVLLAELQRSGARIAPSAVSLQMWRGAGPAQSWADRYPLRLLDRI